MNGTKITLMHAGFHFSRTNAQYAVHSQAAPNRNVLRTQANNYTINTNFNIATLLLTFGLSSDIVAENGSMILVKMRSKHSVLPAATRTRYSSAIIGPCLVT